MNINIPRDSHGWLFEPRPSESRCLWSLGRYKPACNVGDPIVFRFDRKPVALAIVASIHPPGEHDCISHHGLRSLRGYKVTWNKGQFVDLREHPDVIDAIRRQDKKVSRHHFKAGSHLYELVDLLRVAGPTIGRDTVRMFLALAACSPTPLFKGA